MSSVESKINTIEELTNNRRLSSINTNNANNKVILTNNKPSSRNKLKLTNVSNNFSNNIERNFSSNKINSATNKKRNTFKDIINKKIKNKLSKSYDLNVKNSESPNVNTTSSVRNKSRTLKNFGKMLFMSKFSPLKKIQINNFPNILSNKIEKNINVSNNDNTSQLNLKDVSLNLKNSQQDSNNITRKSLYNSNNVFNNSYINLIRQNSKMQKNTLIKNILIDDNNEKPNIIDIYSDIKLYLINNYNKDSELVNSKIKLIKNYAIVNSSVNEEIQLCNICTNIPYIPLECSNCEIIYCYECIYNKVLQLINTKYKNINDINKELCVTLNCVFNPKKISRVIFNKYTSKLLIKCKNTEFNENTKNENIINSEDIYCNAILPLCNYFDHTENYCNYRIVDCPNTSCNTKLVYKNLNYHLEYSCNFNYKICPNIDCNENVLVKNITTHLNNLCQERTYVCHDGCLKQIKLKNKENHSKYCMFLTFTCSLCNKKTFNVERDKHNCYLEEKQRYDELKLKYLSMLEEKLEQEKNSKLEIDKLNELIKKTDIELTQEKIIIKILREENQKLLKKKIIIEEEKNESLIELNAKLEENNELKIKLNEYEDELLSIKNTVIKKKDRTLNSLNEENNVLLNKIKLQDLKINSLNKSDKLINIELLHLNKENSILVNKNTLLNKDIEYFKNIYKCKVCNIISSRDNLNIFKESFLSKIIKDNYNKDNTVSNNIINLNNKTNKQLSNYSFDNDISKESLNLIKNNEEDRVIVNKDFHKLISVDLDIKNQNKYEDYKQSNNKEVDTANLEEDFMIKQINKIFLNNLVLLVECNHCDNLICNKCLNHCSLCKKILCYSLSTCDNCNKTSICINCTNRCNNCNKITCSNCNLNVNNVISCDFCNIYLNNTNKSSIIELDDNLISCKTIKTETCLPSTILGNRAFNTYKIKYEVNFNKEICDKTDFGFIKFNYNPYNINNDLKTNNANIEISNFNLLLMKKNNHNILSFINHINAYIKNNSNILKNRLDNDKSTIKNNANNNINNNNNNNNNNSRLSYFNNLNNGMVNNKEKTNNHKNNIEYHNLNILSFKIIVEIDFHREIISVYCDNSNIYTKKIESNYYYLPYFVMCNNQLNLINHKTE